MKKCNTCNIQYENNINYCKKCGTKLEYVYTTEELEKINKSKEDTNKKIKITRFVIGIIFIITGISTKPFICGLLTMIFGLTITPFLDMGIRKISISFYEKNINWLRFVVPVIVIFILGCNIPEEKLELIEFNEGNNIIVVNDSVNISFKTNLSKYDINDFKFESSDEKIATFINGIATGKSAGEVTLYIKGENNVVASKKYNVIYVNIESIDINLLSNEIEIGNSISVPLKITPQKISIKELTWESSNPSVASIDQNGNINAISKGITTITVRTDNGLSASKEIVVKNNYDIEEDPKQVFDYYYNYGYAAGNKKYSGKTIKITAIMNYAESGWLYKLVYMKPTFQSRFSYSCGSYINNSYEKMSNKSKGDEVVFIGRIDEIVSRDGGFAPEHGILSLDDCNILN